MRITPTGAGDVKLNVAANVAQDGAGNGNTAASEVTVDEQIVPTVQILEAPTSFSDLTPFDIKVEFSEEVTGFISDDLDVTNAALSDFNDAANPVFTMKITPTGAGDVKLNVAANVAQDGAGNGNTAASEVTIDEQIVPNVQILDAPTSFSDLTPFAVRVVFDEEVFGFVDGELQVGNGTPSILSTVDNITYTADITPTGTGDVTLNVAANVAQDGSGNGNTAASQKVVTDLTDTTSPTVEILDAPDTYSDLTPFAVRVVFDEEVTGFELADLVVGYGSVGNLATTDGVVAALPRRHLNVP